MNLSILFYVLLSYYYLFLEKLIICKKCFMLIHKQRVISEFKNKVDEAKKDRLMLWYVINYNNINNI